MSVFALSAFLAGISIAGAVTTFRRARGTSERRYLVSVFALFLGIGSVPLVIMFARPLYPVFMPAALPMLLALPLAIFLYAKTLTRQPESIAPSWWDVFVPSAGLLVMLGYWALPGASRQTMFVDGELPPGLLPFVLAVLTLVLIALWSVMSFVYLIMTTRDLRRHRRRMKDLYSNVEQHELRWIDGFLALLVILWATAATSLLSDNFGPGLPFPPEAAFIIAALTLLVLISFALAPKPQTPDSLGEETSPQEPRGAKYDRSALSQERAQQIAQRIEKAMRSNELYLDANLSLQKLSQQVGAPPNHVSQTLNEVMETNFFDYVSRWRIKAAKPLILANKSTVLDVALEVGFNSRSTFYKAFKRETGVTPKAYLEDQQKRDVS